ncbi:MAG: VCBS repeat-containing protein [Patescibacteria group bacterium]
MAKKVLLAAIFIAMLGFLWIATPAQAVTGHMSSVSVSGTSTTLGATNNLTFTMVTSQNIPASTRFIIYTWKQGGVPCSGTECNFDFGSFSLSGADVSLWSDGSLHPTWGSFIANSELSGTITVTLTGVINPNATGAYTVQVGLQLPPDDSSESVTASNPLFLGDLAVVGKITNPDGSAPCVGVDPYKQCGGVNVRTQDFSFNYGTGVDSNGYYAIPVVTDRGTFQSGQTYFVELFPAQGASGIVPPDASSFVYSGAMVTKNLSFVVAAKTINITVKYDNGSVVTNANVWANKRGGGSNVGGTVDSSGIKALTVSGGSWDVGVNCPWNQQTNSPGNCDWAYNQPPVGVEFALNSVTEAQSLTFTVIKATAVIKGKAVLPDGSPLPNGNVNIQKDGGMGLGTGLGQDGTFSVNVPAGNYNVSVNPDMNNPAYARYYSATIPVGVVDNQTKDLGTIIMSQKNSTITGKVVLENGTGVSGVRINGWVMNGGGWGNATSGIDGSFSMYVSAGNWQINIDNGPQSGNYIPNNNRSIDVTVADSQSVNAGDIVVKLADATLQVKMVDASGNAISNMFGYAYARKQGSMNGSGNEFGSGINQGTATIRLIGGATFIVGANLPSDAGIGYSLKEEVEVAVALGETKVVKVTLVANDSTISGFVKDQNGFLVTNLDAEVYVNDDSWQWRGTRLQPDGSFTFSVRGGKKYMAGVNVRGGSGAYVASQPRPEDAFVVPTNSTYTKIVTILKADTAISGIVLKPDGTPMQRAWVNANNYRSMENKIKGDVAGARIVDTGTQTGADGKFSIAVLAGKYDVHAGMPPEFSGNFMPPKEVSVDVASANPVTGVTLQFREADATATVTLLLPDGTKPDMGFCHAWSEQGGNSGKEANGGVSNVPLTTGTWNVGCDSYNPKTDKFYRSDENQVSVTKGKNVTLSVKMQEGLFNIPKGVTETFDATTQKVMTLPDGTSLTIPANALATSGNVTLMATPDVNLMHTRDTKPINFAWNFEALDSNNQLVQTFNSNATICIPYDKGYLDKIGIDENTIVAKYYNSTNGSWQLPEGTTQDFVSHKVCFSVSHFTNFALATGSRVTASAGGPQYIVATPTSKGGPQVTIWDGNGKAKLSFFAFDSKLRVGINVAYGDVNGDGVNEIIVVPGAGAGPQVKVFSLQGKLLKQFFAYASTMRTGVNLVVSDVDGDGTAEIITSTMAGAGPQVRVFNGNGAVEKQFMAYATTFRGGVNFATGDVDGDGVPEIITVPAAKSAPQVRVFNYDGTVVSQFFAYATTIRGGYHVTTGDADGNGSIDIVITPEPGLGPQVAIFNGAGGLVKKFMAYATTFRGGLYAAVGDVNGDGTNEIIATPESQAGPQVRIFTYQGAVLKSFFAYASTLRGSFTTVVADVNSDGTNEIVTAPGAGMGPQVRVFNYSGTALKTFFTHATGFRGGLNITSIPTF